GHRGIHCSAARRSHPEQPRYWENAMIRPRHAYLMASTALVLILAAGAFAQQSDKGKTGQATVPFADPYRAESPAVPAVPPAKPQSAADEPPPPTVVAEQPPPDPMAALDPADRAIAEKIRELLAAKPDRFFSGKKERGAIEAFYQSRNLLPLWLDK